MTFPWVLISNEASWYPLNVTYPIILAMSQTMKEDSDPVGSRSTKTLSISNKSIEIGMNISNLRARMVKTVNINQE